MMKRLRSIRVNLLQVFFILTASVCVGWFIHVQYSLHHGASLAGNQDPQQEGVSIVQDTSYHFTRPLRYFDLKIPSSQLQSLQQSIGNFIRENRDRGNLFQASIYIRDMENGEWTSVNEEEGYHPGSLIKVPMLMYYLKEAETNPRLLDEQLILTEGAEMIPAQSEIGLRITPGKPYRIRDLLRYMVSHSDNQATHLLNMHCDIAKFKKVFTDLQLKEPDVTDTNFSMSIRDYSVFLRVLYNATYLNAENSEFALSLMAESSFNLGLSNRLPKDIQVARKFGEFDFERKKELHESGIIYCNQHPYLITIMTKGYNSMNLADFIARLSEMVYQSFCH